MTRTRARRWAAVGTLVVAAGLAAGLVIWASRPDSANPAPRARAYASFSQCLLTDSAGVGAAQAAAVWAGMQKASASTTAMSSFLAVPAGTAPDEVVSYADTLLVRSCDVVLAVGPAQVRAMQQVASGQPGRHFVLIGDAPAAANTAVVAPSPPAAVTG